MKKEDEDLYCKVISKWGEIAQIDMAIEEMAELMQALCNSKRGLKAKGWIYNLYEEIADVEIMLEQLKLIFDGGNMVEIYRYQKLDRLKERLESEKDKEDQLNKEDMENLLQTRIIMDLLGIGYSHERGLYEKDEASK